MLIQLVSSYSIFLAIIYVFNLLKRRKDFLFDFLNQKVTLFNIYLYISIPFILLQANGQYWLAGNSMVL